MKTSITAIIAFLSAAALSACAPLTPNLDSQFGDAVNMAKAQQTLNPDAPQRTEPVRGIDGKAGQAAMDSYHESFKAPPPASVTNIINIGGGK